MPNSTNNNKKIEEEEKAGDESLVAQLGGEAAGNLDAPSSSETSAAKKVDSTNLRREDGPSSTSSTTPVGPMEETPASSNGESVSGGSGTAGNSAQFGETDQEEGGDDTVDTATASTTTGAIAQLVRGWDEYMSDPNAEAFPMLKNLQLSCGPPENGELVAQHLRQNPTAAAALMIPTATTASATASGSAAYYGPPSSMVAGLDTIGTIIHPTLAPPALRHTHSSPLKYGTSIFDRYYSGEDEQQHQQQGGSVPPPPVPLDPFQRSSSTPASSFRRTRSTNSAFNRISSSQTTASKGSASAISSTRASYVGGPPPGRYCRISAFDPVKYYTRALEDMERTSIEVTATTAKKPPPSATGATTDGAADSDDNNNNNNKGAASRAAKFLSDVRVLRRVRHNRRIVKRGGRDNPTAPSPQRSSASSSVSSSPRSREEEEENNGSGQQQQKQHSSPTSTSSTELDGIAAEVGGGFGTSVTVITTDVGADNDNSTEGINVNDASMFSRSSEVSAILNMANNGGEEEKSEELYGALVSESEGEEEQADEDEESSRHHKEHHHQPYHQLESDAEDELHNLRSAATASSRAESPGSVKSPSYQQIIDDRPASTNLDNNKTSLRNKMRVQLPKANEAQSAVSSSSAAASPSPTRMVIRDGSSTPRSSGDSITTTSPGASGASSSSGHTTQATFSSSGGNQSGLSTISETDREVMEANKQGRRRRGLDEKLNRSAKRESEGGSSANSNSTNSSNPQGYLALDGSPILRDGANVPAERFFMNAPSSSGLGRISPSIRARRSGQSGSPGTIETATQTSSSGSSCEQQEQPPTFVSYLDREPSDSTTSARDSAEAPSTRRDPDAREDREDSPAAELLGYTELIFEEANLVAGTKSKRATTTNTDRGHRSRPPRSPTKGMRPLTTPPPRGSVSPLLHQHSPPRNIVDNHLGASCISRPHVMRKTAPPQSSSSCSSNNRQLFSSICGGPNQLLAPIPDNDDSFVVVEDNSPLTGPDSIVNFDDGGNISGGNGMFPVGTTLRGCRYTDGSVEISKGSSPSPPASPALVTPEKDTGNTP